MIAFLAALSFFLPSEVRVERDIWVDAPLNSVKQYAPHLNPVASEEYLEDRFPEIGFEEVGKRTRVSLALTTQLGKYPLGKYRGLVLDASLGARMERGLADFAEQVMVAHMRAARLHPEVDSFSPDSLSRAVAGK